MILYSVSNTNKNYQFVETSDWLNYTKDFIQFFPKWEILGEFSDIIYYVNVSLTTSSFTLFKLTIQNNTINSICGQNDILFTAGLLKSINLTSRVMINDIVSLNLIAVQGISFYNNFFHLSNTEKKDCLKNSVKNQSWNTHWSLCRASLYP